MKKMILLLIISTAFISTQSCAQIQKGNLLVGGDLANLNLTLGGGTFNVNIDPKLAFFIKDNTAVGAYLNFGLNTSKGTGSSTSYGVGALARYYVNDPKINVLHQGRLFFEGNVGIQGLNDHGNNTNGLGLGIGPGYAYFITPNIGLETLLKYNGIVGFGSQPYNSNINLGIGFQIYLPGRSARTIINEVK